MTDWDRFTATGDVSPGTRQGTGRLEHNQHDTEWTQPSKMGQKIYGPWMPAGHSIIPTHIPVATNGYPRATIDVQHYPIYQTVERRRIWECVGWENRPRELDAGLHGRPILEFVGWEERTVGQ